MSSHIASLRSTKSAANARALRKAMTDAEHRIWYYLRAHRFLGLHVRRQVPLGPYVVDFLCESQRLVIEIDGGQHGDRQEADATRTEWLAARGYRVLRFWNNEVMENTGGVMEAIAAAVTPRPSPKGEGEMRDPLPGPPPRGREKS